MAKKQTYATLAAALKQIGVEEPEKEAELLLCRLFSLSPASLAAARQTEFSSDALDEAIERRRAHEPLAYILGTEYFWRQEYLVTHDCLIPRADTEILVEEALKILPRGSRFLDLCTGSGCIALSLLCERPDLRAAALDLYPATLDVAKKNAERLGVTGRVTFVLGDALHPDALLPHVRVPNAKFDVIVSNPPYIPAAIIPTLSPEVQSEPHAALDGGTDGLCFFCAILSRQDELLAPDGTILFEIGYDQGDALRSLAAAHGFSCRIVRDLGGNDRVAILTHS